MSKLKKKKLNSKNKDDIQKLLEESREILNMVMSNVPQHIFWKNRDCVYLGCNQNFAKAIDLNSPNEIINKTDFDIINNDDNHKRANHFMSMDKQVMATDIPIYNLIESHKNAKGETVWVNINKIPLHNAQGSVIGILGTVSDVTQQIKMNNKIISSEEKYRNLIEFTNTAYLIMDLNLQIIETNETFVNMIGAPSLQSIVGRNPRTWVHKDDIPKFDKNFKLLLEGNTVNDIDINLITINGKTIYINLTSTIIENGKKKIFCLSRDISYKRIKLDSKRINEQKRKDKLIQSIRAIRNEIRIAQKD